MNWKHAWNMSWPVVVMGLSLWAIIVSTQLWVGFIAGLVAGWSFACFLKEIRSGRKLINLF